jgi:mRNA export factor
MSQGGANGDYLVNSSPTDCISSISWSPVSSYFVAGSWSKDVRCWEVQTNGNTVPKAMLQHAAPVLCTDFSSDGQRVFSGGCDNIAKMWQLSTNQSSQIAQHDAPIKEIFWISDLNCVVTGSWDKTLKYWDTRSSAATATVKLPERVYCMDVKSPLLVVGTAERKLLIYDLRKPTVAFRDFLSPLKFQSRCISCFPDKTGFAVGSIEGRVAISHVEEKDLKKNFAFKCHRHGSNGNEVYAVNSISFHQRYGTFATAGSDGGYVFWDKDSKQRLKLFNRAQTSITCSSFNRDGSIYAYALSYDWSKGAEFYDKNKPNQIFLHAVQDAEIAPREKRG